MSISQLGYELWLHNSKLPVACTISMLEEGMTPEQIHGCSALDLIRRGINLQKADEILKNRKFDYSETEEYLAKENIHYIMYNCSEFPNILKNIPNPPIGLFVKGELPRECRSIGIVGARRATQYGKTSAYKIAYELSRYDVTVVSGMARGIDTAAHHGAIDGKGKTIAVMGSGFKNIYPSENRGLYREILQNGCVVTEYMPEEQPLAFHFPLRNRIISGLSTYILVVEAGERSGSLTTAGLALDQGKDVFAIPGGIFSPNSIGTNSLIRDGAKIITSTRDILMEFGQEALFEGADMNKNTNTVTAPLSLKEKKMLALIGSEGVALDQILEQTDESLDQILSMIGMLECKGIIKRAFGNYYIIA